MIQKSQIVVGLVIGVKLLPYGDSKLINLIIMIENFNDTNQNQSKNVQNQTKIPNFEHLQRLLLRNQVLLSLFNQIVLLLHF